MTGSSTKAGAALTVGDGYATLPHSGPNTLGVGHAFITIAEPHPGFERAYNRWYEDDHFFGGGMVCPWLFAGKRWVATRDLQRMRQPATSSIADPITMGCYLATYWITPGRAEDTSAWMFAANDRLVEAGRNFPQKSHVFTSLQDTATLLYRDDEVVRAQHALSYDYAGIVVEIIEVSDPSDRADLTHWLAEEHIPAVLRGSAAAMCGVFHPIKLGKRALASSVGASAALVLEAAAADDRRVTLLWFLDQDPRRCWDEAFLREADRIGQSGKGQLQLLAPFIPSVMGTDRFVDQLR
jgi:hypothetical protein